MRKIAVVGTLVALVALVAACKSGSGDEGATPAPEPAAAPYAMPDVLGVRALEDENPDPNVVEVTLSAAKSKASFLPGKTTPVLAYNGSLPGPLLKAKVGDDVIVHFKNDLPEPTTIHWHGLRISDQMDGTTRVQSPIKPGGEFTYRFRVPDAGSFWYHPHLTESEQIEAGLSGPIVVFDPKDPVYDAERYLVLKDIRLESDGTISPPSSMDGMMSGRFGNVLLTNGRPAKEAHASVDQGAVERWRIVNTANARTMELAVAGASFRVIATDGGLLPQPFATKRLTVAVGQRFDIEVTYDEPGVAKLVSYALTADAQGNATETAFDAFTVDVAPNDRAPRAIDWPTVTLPDRAPTAKATLTFDVGQDAQGMTEWRINGKADSMDPFFTWPQGSTVDVSLVNNVQMDHPIHFHGQFFEVLDGKQPGLHDVVMLPASSTLKIRAFVDNPGRWMIHCHILEHQELGMMGEIDVTPDPNAPPLGPPRPGP